MTFIQINKGKMEIHTRVSDIKSKPAFIASTAADAARWLHEHGIDDWYCSSTMEFSMEHGWPNDNAYKDLEEAFVKEASNV